MSKLPERVRERSWISELSDTFNGLPAWGLRPLFADGHVIRLEEDMQDGHYLVRAEITPRAGRIPLQVSTFVTVPPESMRKTAG